jgi:hypothetical protein
VLPVPVDERDRILLATDRSTAVTTVAAIYFTIKVRHRSPDHTGVKKYIKAALAGRALSLLQ